MSSSPSPFGFYPLWIYFAFFFTSISSIFHTIAKKNFQIINATVTMLLKSPQWFLIHLRMKFQFPCYGIQDPKGLGPSDPASLSTSHFVHQQIRECLYFSIIISLSHAFTLLYLSHENTPFLFFSWIIPTCPLRLIRFLLIKKVFSLS